MLLSLPPQGWVYKCVLPCLTFYVDSGNQTQVLIDYVANTLLTIYLPSLCVSPKIFKIERIVAGKTCS